jgi:hypothetical protein
MVPLGSEAFPHPHAVAPVTAQQIRCAIVVVSMADHRWPHHDPAIRLAVLMSKDKVSSIW